MTDLLEWMTRYRVHVVRWSGGAWCAEHRSQRLAMWEERGNIHWFCYTLLGEAPGWRITGWGCDSPSRMREVVATFMV